MGSKVKKLAPLALLALPFIGPALAGSSAMAGSGIMSAGVKKFLMNQAITAGLSKATTGKIDPKAQLMAGIMSGVGSMAGPKTSALASGNVSSALQNAAGAGTVPSNLMLPGRPSLLMPTQASNLSLASLSGAPASTASTVANLAPTQAFNTATQTAATGGGGILQGLGSSINNAMYTKPTDLAGYAKSLAAYGGPSLAAAAMQTPKVDDSATEKENQQAQAFYDTAANMNRAMGGPGGMGMSYEDMNDATGGYLSTMKGTVGNKLTSDDNPAGAQYVSMYPDTNYDGLNIFTTDTERFKRKPSFYNPYVMPQYAAEGGMIDPLEEMPIITPIESESDRRMREAMEEIKRLQAEGFDFSQGNPVPDQYAEVPMTSMNYEGRANGGLMQVASAPDPMAERFDMLENLSLEMFKKPLNELQAKEIEILEGMIDMMDQGMADGGRVPQTKSIPQGMQIDGRGGGFIPMGAKEKHDDVPAMLAKNEFVMTSDAVKAAGGGSVNKGAQVMYDLMNSLESKV